MGYAGFSSSQWLREEEPAERRSLPVPMPSWAKEKPGPVSSRLQLHLCESLAVGSIALFPAGLSRRTGSGNVARSGLAGVLAGADVVSSGAVDDVVLDAEAVAACALRKAGGARGLGPWVRERGRANGGVLASVVGGDGDGVSSEDRGCTSAKVTVF